MSFRRPLILLPPSEGKAAGGRGRAWQPGSMSFPELDRRRAELMAALASTMDGSGLSALLGVKGEALDRAVAANRAVMEAPTMPAIRRYTGVLYQELDWPSLTTAARRRGARQIVTFSGLWGLVRPGDRIPDYKLKMGARLGSIGSLNRWWRPAIDDALGTPAMTWNLLPNEHDVAWTGRGPEVRVRFLDDVGSGRARKLISVSHWNKLLKGALVRHLLETGLDDPVGLAEFHHPLGYVARPDLTETSGESVTVSLVARR